MYTKKLFRNKFAKKRKLLVTGATFITLTTQMSQLLFLCLLDNGKDFQDTMNRFITDIKVDIKTTFNNEEFEKEKNNNKARIRGQNDQCLNGKIK